MIVLHGSRSYHFKFCHTDFYWYNIYIKDRYLGFEFSFFSKSVGSGLNTIYANIIIDTTQNKFIRL
ncbi:MAG: hypothetical protein QN716_09590, partial [Nitrososphaeraceae archaeon]|nr:hypothetical protein [Nitrososphaeraceae archaeon]